jgi:NitT/TauT family transport system substrate-binding protein
VRFERNKPDSKRSQRALFLILLVFALVAAACGGGDGGSDDDGGSGTSDGASDEAAGGDEGGELEPITFLLTNERSIQYHPIHIAEKLGYFEEEGLDVQVEVVDGSSAAMQQLIAGNGDISLPSAPAVVQAVAQDHDPVWFYTYFYANVFGLSTPTETGITDLEGLKGKVIGVSEPSGGEVPLIRGAMAGVGLTDGTDYTVQAIGEGDASTFEALERGRADAYSSSVFDVAAVEAAGMELTPLLPAEFTYMPSQGLVAMRDTYEEKRDAMVGFARAQAKAKVWADANPDAAKAIAEEYGPELFEDPELAESIWDATQFLFGPPEDLEEDPNEVMGTHYLPGWDFYLDFISQGTEEEGAVPAGTVDTGTLITDELLPDINDFDKDAVAEEAEAYEG